MVVKRHRQSQPASRDHIRESYSNLTKVYDLDYAPWKAGNVRTYWGRCLRDKARGATRWVVRGRSESIYCFKTVKMPPASIYAVLQLDYVLYSVITLFNNIL